MNSNQMVLKNAGIREHIFAQKLVQEKKLPVDISYQDLLSYGVYDTTADEIFITVKAVVFSFKVSS